MTVALRWISDLRQGSQYSKTWKIALISNDYFYQSIKYTVFFLLVNIHKITVKALFIMRDSIGKWVYPLVTDSLNA